MLKEKRGSERDWEVVWEGVGCWWAGFFGSETGGEGD